MPLARPYLFVLISHSINGYVVKKQQSRLTLQKATKVVEGKMYILPDFSLKKKNNKKQKTKQTNKL
jgi:DNA-binding NarL/FixJ family response regulator